MTAAAVEVRDLGKAFGGLRAVDGVTLAVAPGERRALIGPNGAGKTTLFHCITGTLQATSGQVKLYGHDVTREPEHRRTKLGMGRTFQITNVFADLTLSREHGAGHHGHRSAQVDFEPPSVRVPGGARAGALRACGGGSRRTCRPSGELLSYGERRQLELALALGTRPKVLFLDEPCAGLSPSERQRIFAMVRGLPRDITVVMIEHDMDVALGIADRVTVMNRGRVMAEGTPEQVQSDPNVRDVYFGHV